MKPSSIEEQEFDPEVSNVIDEIIDKVARDCSSELIFKKVKENIIGESIKDYNSKLSIYTTKLEETIKLVESCDKKIALYKKIEKNYLPLVANFNQKFLQGEWIKTDRRTELEKQRKEWDLSSHETALDSLAKFFGSSLEEETKKMLMESTFEGWNTQNEKVRDWMLTKIEFFNFPGEEDKFGNIEQIKQKLPELLQTKSLLEDFFSKLPELKGASSDPTQKKEIESTLSKIVEDTEFTDFNNSKRIVWVSVGKDGDKSDFSYPGKTKEKSVNITYHNIQKNLIEATTIICNRSNLI